MFSQLMTQQRELPLHRHTLQTRLEPPGQRGATYTSEKSRLKLHRDTHTHTGITPAVNKG